MAMRYTQVTVAGGGVLGSQIAFQTAFKGFQVTVYDISDGAIERAKERIAKLRPHYQADLAASEEALQEANDRITFQSDLTQAVAEADLVVEAIPEIAQIKTEFYTQLGKLAPAKTVFITNSSTLLPSRFAEATGRPSQFLALHFANYIWRNNTAEVMKHAGTDIQVFHDVIDFAKSIGMIALPLYKEQPGYILNSLLVPLLSAAQQLLIREVSDVETIDKTWMVATGAPLGPFAILDIVGINTAFNIVSARAAATGDQEAERIANLLKTEFIDKGKLGRATGEGFYKYPNPNFLKPDFKN